MSENASEPFERHPHGEGLPTEQKAAWLLTQFIAAIRRLPAEQRPAKLKEAERRLYEIRRYELERPTAAEDSNRKGELKFPYE